MPDGWNDPASVEALLRHLIAQSPILRYFSDYSIEWTNPKKAGVPHFLIHAAHPSAGLLLATDFQNHVGLEPLQQPLELELQHGGQAYGVSFEGPLLYGNLQALEYVAQHYDTHQQLMQTLRFCTAISRLRLEHNALYIHGRREVVHALAKLPASALHDPYEATPVASAFAIARVPLIALHQSIDQVRHTLRQHLSSQRNQAPMDSVEGLLATV